MNRKRIIAISKLVLLFGTPLAFIFGLFSCGVYWGAEHNVGILGFERDWLGLDVDVPGESSSNGETKSGETKSGETKSGEAKSGEAKSGETKSGETKSGETKSGETGPTTVAHGPTDTPPGTSPATGPTPPATTPGMPGAVPAPLPPLDAKVDPLDDGMAARRDVPIVVKVKVLVDEPFVQTHADWVDVVQRTLSRASRVYDQQFGVQLQLWAIGRWDVPTEGMGAHDLLVDLSDATRHGREGADIVLGFTGRPHDGTLSGTANTPAEDGPFNGAHAVVYPTSTFRETHLRTLLHEVGHLLGAKDIVDPAHPGWKAGSWMSYAVVAESQAPWIDPDNRQRILERKDLPFAPDEIPQPPTPASDEGSRTTDGKSRRRGKGRED